MTTETTTVMGTAAGYDCIDMLAVSNDEAATNKSTEDARIFTAEPGKAIRPALSTQRGSGGGGRPGGGEGGRPGGDTTEDQ